MEFEHFSHWYKELKDTDFLLIAGPCSAETYDQTLQTAIKLSKIKNLKVFRAGLWKPRTNPNNFEGVGEKGLDWLKAVKEQTGLLTTTEVASPHHVELCLKSGAVDILWIGARTVTNPFSVQDIAYALQGTDIPVMIKNPIHSDLKLWAGAIERLYKAGLKKIAAIHRGFYPFQSTRLRNIPKWEIPINLKTQYPTLPVIGDPSHIAGDTCYIHEVAQKALDINFDGLMVEVHINPSQALSDAKQQLTPEKFEQLLNMLKFRTKDFNKDFLDQLTYLRHQIDSIDYQIIELLAHRMEIVKEIGRYKNKHDIAIFQLERWKQIQESRSKLAQKLELDPEFIMKIMEIIHKESINVQSKINNNGKN